MSARAWLAEPAESETVAALLVEFRARGHGVGQALMSLALDRARQRGCRRVELDVNERNDAALALYEALGFEITHKPPGGRDVLARRRLEGAA